MMIRRRVVKASLTAATALAALCLASSDALADGNHHGKSCSGVGTWMGVTASGDTYLEIATPGTNATSGQFGFSWVSFDPALGGFFGTAVRVTDAAGVSERKGRRTRFTHVFYGLDATGYVLYTIRASGEYRLTDCDHKETTYTVELFLGESLDEGNLIATLPGASTETRLRLVHPSAP